MRRMIHRSRFVLVWLCCTTSLLTWRSSSTLSGYLYSNGTGSSNDIATSAKVRRMGGQSSASADQESDDRDSDDSNGGEDMSWKENKEREDPESSISQNNTDLVVTEDKESESRCAINFWGLPRAFKSLTLPSVIENVVETNAGYNCDYFVHYYLKTEETPGRSTRGGKLDPTEVLLLEEAVHTVARKHNMNRLPIVKFTMDREEDFWTKYEVLIDKIHNTKVDDNYLYFPWKEKDFEYPTVMDNIVKMWHSIQSAYQLMEEEMRGYKHVAMLRSDVVYVTPIDIYDAPDNKTVTVPGFARYPVNDRIIYGPAPAVKIWSTERFDKLDEHVQYVLKKDPGYGMHSERFIKYTTLPAIRNAGFSVLEHPKLFFFRARPDGTVWHHDCDGRTAKKSIVASLGDIPTALERAIGRKCAGNEVKVLRKVSALNCSDVQEYPTVGE